MLTLDEQLWVPKGSDATFILACNKTHGMKQNANYAEVRTSNVRALVSFSLSLATFLTRIRTHTRTRAHALPHTHHRTSD
jgi:hypothetical protein